MSGTNAFDGDWFDTVKDYTLRLVHIRSVNPSDGETQVAREVLRLLTDGDLDSAYTSIGLDPIEGDPYHRQNAYAFIRGASRQTVVLLGHIDTVDTADYGPLEPWALDPEGLAERQHQLVELAPAVAEDLAAQPGDWIFGRGIIDMKSGVAANIAVMRRLAHQARTGELPLSVVLLATPDEESESSGVLQAVRFLLRLREQHGLQYAGAINTDYTTSRYPGDPHRYVYTGTIGKLLPSFLVIGRESHVGDPLDGFDANLLAAELISDLSMTDELVDVVRGQAAPLPVTLHATDLKAHYDVQLPFAAYFYLNVLTMTTTPDTLLDTLERRAHSVLARTLARIDDVERRWIALPGNEDLVSRHAPRTGRVLRYDALYATAVQQVGEQQVADALADEWARWPAELDRRERSLHLVYRLWTISGLQGPAVVLYYSPPFYPHVAATPCALHQAVADVAAHHTELSLVTQEYFPYLSDMSYLRLDANIDVAALTANMPVWQDSSARHRPGAYSLPLDAIRQLDLPVINLGPYGKGAHQRGERALMSYSFGILPRLVFETVEQLGQIVSE